MGLLFSFFIVAFAQPDWSVVLCVLASIGAYGIFWYFLQFFKHKFFISAVWFGLIQMVHINWLFSDQYVGKALWLFVLFVSVAMGSAFGIFSKYLTRIKVFKWNQGLFFAGIWTIFEWLRLFFLSGYTWDPIGLSLVSNHLSSQLASVGGVFFLSYIVILSNILFYQFLKYTKQKSLYVWVLCIVFPYIFGIISISFHTHFFRKMGLQEKNIYLVQPAFTAEDKGFGKIDEKLSPIQQWERIFALLSSVEQKADLILFPEGTLSYGPYALVIKKEELQECMRHYFGWEFDLQEEYVNHATIAYLLNQVFEADIIIGLEAYEATRNKAYNAAFFFNDTSEDRYVKRILLPIAEYFPFQWCLGFAKKWGITNVFEKGAMVKVFQGKDNLKIGCCICYEETFGHLMRENKKKGADILVNLTNDVWYPNSRLPLAHFHHGKLRTIEQGLPLLRACNTGVTCAVDSFGRTIKALDYETSVSKATPGILHVSLPIYSYKTLYVIWGDYFVLLISIVGVLFFLKKMRLL